MSEGGVAGELDTAASGVALLERAVAALLAESPTDLPELVALDRVRRLLACGERLHAARLAAVRDLDRRELWALDAAGSTRGWLRTQPGGDGGQLMAARRLGQRPLVAEALAAGNLGGRAAEQLCAVLDKVPAHVEEPLLTAVVVDGVGSLLQTDTGGLVTDDDVTPDLLAAREQAQAVLEACVGDTTSSPADRLEPALVLLAQRLAPSHLGPALRQLLEAMLPDGSDAVDRDPYFFELRELLDGDVEIRGLLAPEVGHGLAAELARRMKAAASAEDAPAPAQAPAAEDAPAPAPATPAAHPGFGVRAATAGSGRAGACDSRGSGATQHQDMHAHESLEPAAQQEESHQDAAHQDGPHQDAPHQDADQLLAAWDRAFAQVDGDGRGATHAASGGAAGETRSEASPSSTSGDARASDSVGQDGDRLAEWDAALAGDRYPHAHAAGPPSPPPSAASPPRLISAGRRRHDALAQLLHDVAQTDPGSGAPTPPHLTIIATLPALEGRLGALPAQLVTSGQPATLTTAQLQRLGCYSVVDAVLVDALGNPVGASTSRRNLTPRERRALRAQWGPSCAIAGCPSTVLVPHHVEPYWLSRRTRLRDIIPICEHCHHDVHDGHRTLRLRDGRLINEFGWIRRTASAA